MLAACATGSQVWVCCIRELHFMKSDGAEDDCPPIPKHPQSEFRAMRPPSASKLRLTCRSTAGGSNRLPKQALNTSANQ